MSSIENLKSKIKRALEEIPESSNVFGHINKETLKSRLKRLEKIEKILEKEKYSITFIGTIGSGKTTAISHLFNLTHTIDKKTITKRGKERRIEVIEPLLATGSGRTTICEVIIKPSETISMEIEPYTREELKREIEDFCNTFYDDKSKESSISEELERAIRSIVGLKKNVSTLEKSDSKIDEAKEKAKKVSQDEFKRYAVEKADLDNRLYTRKESRLYCEGGEPKQWIKENFSKLNKGEFSYLSIPKKIYLNINKDIFGESNLDIFSSIIDTKGIDENPIRKDLVEQINEENTIVVFTSSYNDAPKADIRELIEHTLSKKSKKYQDRFILLVMPRNNEPENENDGDGSWVNGVYLKKEIIKKIFKEKKLNFNEENILFYDALQFFDSDGRIDRDYEFEDVQEDKSELLNSINNIIKQRKTSLDLEIQEIERSCYNIQDGDIELTEEDLKKIIVLEQELIDIRTLSKRIPNSVYEEFIGSYVNYYSTRYKAWNTKDAIHRRYGVFSERGYSTYFDAKVVAEGTTQDEMLYKFTKDLKKEVVKLIDDLGSEIISLEQLTPEIIKLFEAEYDTFIDSVGNGVMKFLRDENRNEEFWHELIERRGKGAGYNNDVLRILRGKLKTLRNGLSIDGVLQDYVEKEWEKLIDKVLIFFKK